MMKIFRDESRSTYLRFERPTPTIWANIAM